MPRPRHSRHVFGAAALGAAMLIAVAVLIAVAAVLVAAPAGAEQPEQRTAAIPGAVPAGSSQLITVRTATARATSGTLTAWQQDDSGSWRVVFGPMTARVGANGIGETSEGSSTTPAGTYPLDQAFGRKANPGTAMPYFTTDEQDWWDENPVSPTYNTHVRQSESPGGDSENLLASGSVYDYAVNIDYNPGGVPGAGSAFFLHVSQGVPTAGCVAVPEQSLVSILKWLNPARHPVISLAVGPPWTPAPPLPTGMLAAANVVLPDSIAVSGWAADPSAPGATMTIRAVVTGPFGATAQAVSRTGRSRPDLGISSTWVGGHSGFLAEVPTTGVGINRICVTILTGSGPAAASLGCLYVFVLPKLVR